MLSKHLQCQFGIVIYLIEIYYLRCSLLPMKNDSRSSKLIACYATVLDRLKKA